MSQMTDEKKSKKITKSLAFLEAMEELGPKDREAISFEIPLKNMEDETN